MLRSGGDEEKITSLERFALAFVNQDSPAPDDYVDLVLCMRCLLVRRQRPRQVNVKATAAQKIVDRSPFGPGICACAFARWITRLSSGLLILLRNS